jgi:hypothetical protein
MQRYGLMPAAARLEFCTECGLQQASSGCGESAIWKVGAAKPAADQIVEGAAPAVAALPAHGLGREQHLLTIRTPRTTNSEIAVALWSSRTSATENRRPRFGGGLLYSPSKSASRCVPPTNNCVFAPGVCADPTPQAQLGPGRPDATASLRSGSGDHRQTRQTQKAAGELDGIVNFHVTVRVSCRSKV